MALYDLQENEQNPIGRGEHWRLFIPFQMTPLYRAIVSELDSFVAGKQDIDSSWAGSEILRKLEATSPQLFESENREQLGGLFGMTLWNYLTQHPKNWYFVPKATELDQPQGTKYFQRR